MNCIPRFVSILLAAALLFALLPGSCLTIPVRASEATFSTEPPTAEIQPDEGISVGDGIASGTPSDMPEETASTPIDDAPVPPETPAGSSPAIAEGVPSDESIPETAAPSEPDVGGDIEITTETIVDPDATWPEETAAEPEAPSSDIPRDFLPAVVIVLILVIVVLVSLLIRTRKALLELQSMVRSQQDQAVITAVPKTDTQKQDDVRTDPSSSPTSPVVTAKPSSGSSDQQVTAKPGAPSAISVCGVSGIFAGMRFPLHKQLGFGRDSSCDIRYPANHTGVSRVHCALLTGDEGAVLVDLGSTTGTFLADGTKLKPHHNYPLKRGDCFCVGGPDQTFRIE